MSKIYRGREGGWRVMKFDRDRVEKGFRKIRNLLAKDDRRRREGPSGLPLDGRNRVYRTH